MISERVFYSNSNIEIINRYVERGSIKYAIFDFDGTISLIREGWQSVMITMMVEILLQTPNHENTNELNRIVTEFVDRLTGKQTIYQMIQLTKEIKKRGSKPSSPEVYKKIYNDYLNIHIQDRIDRLERKDIMPFEIMVAGSCDMLESLKAKGVYCYLASGTDKPYVVEEVCLLGLNDYFVEIYGALDNYKSFSKKMIIDKIIKENNLKGSELIVFGDGFVEIENSKSVGGIAVGVASNETTRHGINDFKRARLISAGADLIIPDFRDQKKLTKYLFMDN